MIFLWNPKYASRMWSGVSDLLRANNTGVRCKVEEWELGLERFRHLTEIERMLQVTDFKKSFLTLDLKSQNGQNFASFDWGGSEANHAMQCQRSKSESWMLELKHWVRKALQKKDTGVNSSTLYETRSRPMNAELHWPG